MRIVDIEGIGPVYAAKLRDAGVDTTDELLAAGATPSGRAKLVERTGISHKLILEWVNHADLMRIDGASRTPFGGVHAEATPSHLQPRSGVASHCE